jgi:drug/metabolite transporter (DMT)-like permease
MARLTFILIVALVVEAVGVVWISQGLREIGEMRESSFREAGRLLGRGLTNRWFVLGVFCELIFFALLLVLLRSRDVSLVWPLTSLGFVLTALAARFLRHEEVSPLRWAGVALIVLGAALVGWSEVRKSPPPRTPPGALPPPAGGQ